MSLTKPHGPTQEDCGGYFCPVCGMDTTSREEDLPDCPGPRPLLDKYDLMVAEHCLRSPSAYNEATRLHVADKLLAYITWSGCS